MATKKRGKKNSRYDHPPCSIYKSRYSEIHTVRKFHAMRELAVILNADLS